MTIQKTGLKKFFGAKMSSFLSKRGVLLIGDITPKSLFFYALPNLDNFQVDDVVVTHQKLQLRFEKVLQNYIMVERCFAQT